MTCCQCMSSGGRCINCSCVRKKQPCQGCLPSRLGNCVNTGDSQPVLNLANGVQPSSPTTNDVSMSPQMSSPQVQVYVPSQTLSSQTSNLPESVMNTQSSPGPDQPQRSADSASTHMPLPLFTPMAAPVFTWGEYEAAEFMEL